MPTIKPLSDISVLVVDDTPIVVTMLSALLGGLGLSKISSANSIESALEKFPRFSNCPFDIVFLDRYLGTQSGLEILKALRERFKELPIIMLTQEDEGAKVIEAISAGATDYIVKPFTEDIVATKLSRVLGVQFHPGTRQR